MFSWSNSAIKYTFFGSLLEFSLTSHQQMQGYIFCPFVQSHNPSDKVCFINKVEQDYKIENKTTTIGIGQSC